MAMTAVSRKGATDATSLEEVAGLQGVHDVFISKKGKKTLNNMVRCAATIVMSQFMSDSMRRNYGDQIADFDLFSICMRLCKSSLVDASKLFWSSGILETETISNPKVLSSTLSTIDSIINGSTVANREEEFVGTLFVASSCPAFVTNFERIVVAYHQNEADEDN